MRTTGTHKRREARATVFFVLIGIVAIIHEPKPSIAEPVFSNGFFFGIGDDERFKAFFSEDGSLSIYSEFGDYEGRWQLVGSILCVEFDDGPKAGRRCETVTPEGPLSVKIGDHLFLARLARALRVS